MKSLFIIIGILALAYALICLYVYAKQESIIFYPAKLSSDHVFKFPFPYPFEEVFLEQENAIIHGLFFRQDSARGVVLYLHGNAGNLQDWASVAPQFLEMGFDIFIMDYRGYGKSSGEMSEQALYTDASAAYEHLKGMYPESDIIVYGRSLGTGVAAYIAAFNTPRHLVLETPYLSMADMARSYFPWLPFRLLSRYKLPVKDFLPEVDCPVSVMHGTADEVIPFAHSVELMKVSGDKDITFLQIDGGTHNDLSAYAACDSFLSKRLLTVNPSE